MDLFSGLCFGDSLCMIAVYKTCVELTYTGSAPVKPFTYWTPIGGHANMTLSQVDLPGQVIVDIFPGVN